MDSRKQRFFADFELDRPDPRLVPFLDGKHCLAILTKDNKIRLIPADGYAANSWKDAFQSNCAANEMSPNYRDRDTYFRNRSIRADGDSRRNMHQNTNQDTFNRNASSRNPRQYDEESKAMSHLEQIRQKYGGFGCNNGNGNGRRTKSVNRNDNYQNLLAVHPVQCSPLSPSPRKEWGLKSFIGSPRTPCSPCHSPQHIAPRRAHDNAPCNNGNKLSAKDLSAICGIAESKALAAIRCVNEGGDDCLDSADFEMLKRYINNQSTKKNGRQRNQHNQYRNRRSCSPSWPEEEEVDEVGAVARKIQSQCRRECMQNTCGSTRGSKVTPPNRLSNRTPNSHRDSKASARYKSRRASRNHWDSDEAEEQEESGHGKREEMLLHGKGQKYKVDVILGETNILIGDQKFPLDSISKVQSSKNCCLAILTNSGQIVLQCRNRDVRDRWQWALASKSHPTSRDFAR